MVGAPAQCLKNQHSTWEERSNPSSNLHFQYIETRTGFKRHSYSRLSPIIWYSFTAGLPEKTKDLGNRFIDTPNRCKMLIYIYFYLIIFFFMFWNISFQTDSSTQSCLRLLYIFLWGLFSLISISITFLVTVIIVYIAI